MAVGNKYFAVMKNELAVSNGVATLGPDGLLNASQRPITDSMPTQGSSNPVQSGGVYSALSNKVNKNTPIIWYDLQLQDGFKPSAYAKYGKDDAGWVQIAGAVTHSGGPLKENEVIAILPEGYRPSEFIPIPLIQSSGNWAIFGWIDTDGNIKLTGISPPNGFNQLYGISLGATFKAY